ncbi:MAG: hypothetical protein R2822_14890 [Spirosomataceae bacterium]
MKKNITTIVLSALFIACGQDKAAVNQAEKEVFAVHDEIMPQMSQLMEYQKQLSKEITDIDSSLQINTNDSLQKRKEEALSISSMLKEADNGMMDWMHDYKGDSLKALASEESLKAMSAEKTKIDAVKVKMTESMAKAKAFLNHD